MSNSTPTREALAAASYRSTQNAFAEHVRTHDNQDPACSWCPRP